MGFITVVSEELVELSLELLLEVDECFLAHHFYLRCNTLIKHALPLESLRGKHTFDSFLIFTIWWLIYFVKVIIVFFVDVVLAIFTSCGASRQLVLDIRLALRRLRELDEEVGHTAALKELLLGLFAILIHSISYKFEVNGSSLDDALDVCLLVVVREHD